MWSWCIGLSFGNLRRIKASNVNRLNFGQLNINSLRNKFDDLKYLIMDNIDILIITESKLCEGRHSM